MRARYPMHKGFARVIVLFLILSVLSGCLDRSIPSSLPDLTRTSESSQSESTLGESSRSEATLTDESTIETTAPDTDPGVSQPRFDESDLIYFVMTDRFADGDPDNNSEETQPNDPAKRHGGDFAGILERLDYIEAVGATAIWLTPVQTNTLNGYHGYWINDFLGIDPHLGSLGELKSLVQEAHAREIKVILDVVANHTGYDSDILINNPSWFHDEQTIHNFNNRQERENGWLSGLPDFNQEVAEAADYLIEAALWLIEASEIDGMRLDTVMHVPTDFWQTFSARIRAVDPEFYLLGEAYSYQPSVIKYYQQFGLDGMLNYPLYDALRQSYARAGDASAIKSAILADQALDFHERNGNFLDNHDNTRFMSYLMRVDESSARERYLQALNLIMTYEGIPLIYYGTEIAMEGQEDPDNRRDMDFSHWDNGSAEEELLVFDFYRKLLRFREGDYLRENEGRFELLSSDDDLLLYQHGSAIVALNFSDRVRELRLAEQVDDEVRYADYLADPGLALDLENNPIVLAPHGTSIIVALP